MSDKNGTLVIGESSEDVVSDFEQCCLGRMEPSDADWTASILDDVEKCGTIWTNAKCSNILLIEFKLEIGR